MNQQDLQKLSDSALTGELRPYLEEAYDLMGINEAWLKQLIQAVRSELQQPADVVPLTEWALSDTFSFSPAAEKALESEQATGVLVRLVAELAHIVLLDEATATTILSHLQQASSPADQVRSDQIVQAALTGHIAGPPLPQVMSLLGKERCMNRAATIIRS